MVSFFKSAYQQLENFTAIELFYIAIAVFTTIILALIVAMLVIMLGKKRIATREKQLQAQLKHWLVSIILQEPKNSKITFDIPESIKSILQGGVARRALLEELIRLKNNLSGQSGDNLQQLYNQLRLDRLSAQHMRSNRWYLKAQGIQELAAMGQTDYQAEIYALTQHPNNMVRMEAQTALVYLQGYAGLTFFDQLTYPLNEWHQIKLLQLLANQPIPSPNMIKAWLVSENASVIQFALKLISEQHASQFQQDVIACLSHPEEYVRSQAIACLGEIPLVPAALALRTHYTSENSKTLRHSILTELMKIGTTHDVPFLEQLRVTPDEGIRLAVEKTILHLQQQALTVH